ncbi:MAG: amidohydrolase, partial [Planctomycetes bacterium]|nr:amidohydrolase [Planctomycetota bacterium]
MIIQKLYCTALASLVLIVFLSPNGLLAQQQENVRESGKPTIYFGGDILTMRGLQPEYVEGLAIKDGKIVAAGAFADCRKVAGSDAKIVDLGGKTLLPGFIDNHGHFVYFGKNLIDA